MALNKIVKLNLEEQACELKQQGLSDYQIADKLSQLAGDKITQSSVWRYFNQNKDPIIQHAKQREEIVSRAINGRLDVVAQLNKINELALNLLAQAIDSNNSNQALKAMKEVREQLEFQAKLLGDLPDQHVNINIQSEVAKFEQKIVGIIAGGLCNECRARLESTLEGARESYN